MNEVLKSHVTYLISFKEFTVQKLETHRASDERDGCISLMLKLSILKYQRRLEGEWRLL